MKTVARIYVSAVIWCVGSLQMIFWTSLILGLSTVVPVHKLAPLVRLAARSIVRGAGIRVRVQGLEHIPTDRPVVLMGNHVNLIDPFLTTAVFPRPFVGLEKASHFGWPVYGWYIKRWGNIPVYMERPAAARATLRAAQAALREGLCLIVFPEGTRTPTGTMGPFHKGAFYIAQRAGADIVPFSTRGSYKINQRNSWLVRPGTIDVVISPPLPAAEWARRPLDELMEVTRAAIARHAD